MLEETGRTGRQESREEGSRRTKADKTEMQAGRREAGANRQRARLINYRIYLAVNGISSIKKLLIQCPYVWIWMQIWI
jgi:hypothetical protein